MLAAVAASETLKQSLRNQYAVLLLSTGQLLQPRALTKMVHFVLG